MQANESDIVIVGAGIVGLTAACLLGGAGLSISIVDSDELPRPLPLQDFSLRVSAINRSAEMIFKACGVWDQIKGARFCAYQRMRVWDEQGNGGIEFSARESLQPNLGYIIENDILRQALLNRVAVINNIKCFPDTALAALQAHDTGYRLQTKTELEFNTKLVLAADGANSWVRQQAEIPLTMRDYEHHALVATIGTEKPHQATAYQRFLREGPLAFLPLAEPNTCSIVWSAPPERIELLKSLLPADFEKQLAESLERYLGDCTLLSARQCFPLVMRHAQYYVLPRLALLGDAAHTIHPLAGQGLNLGLMDAKVLSGVIKQALVKKRDFSAYDTLRRYARARKEANVTMLAAMSGFKAGFTSDNPLLVGARNVGLTVVNQLPVLKSQLMRYALGLTEA